MVRTGHTHPVAAPPLVLLTGATGYIGGRLLKLLEGRGARVRCMARQPARLVARVGGATEVVEGDVADYASLRGALAAVDTAYYLVHAMGSAGSFREQDRAWAENFGRAAKEAGVRRIIYLGGLGHGDDLSEHLASRQEVGDVLRASGVPILEFRSGVIIGSGSLSFAMVRALVEKLPVMITPRWVRTPTQPISVRDVLDYLIAALDHETHESVIYEIGGADQTSYLGMMKAYAKQRGLRRLFVPVPFLTPWLSSRWLGLVTPVYARVGRKLIEGLRNETVVTDDRALRDFPGIQPADTAEAVARALKAEDDRVAETRWSDARSSFGTVRRWGGVKFGSRLVDSRVVKAPGTPAQMFAPIQRIGGKRGWYYGTWLWRVRGFIDLLCGGPGLRRGRRHPVDLRQGDTLDFWRVEEFEADHLLRLYAEMKVPGRAWLQFEVTPEADGQTAIRQTAVFDPIGLGGLLYWYGVYPLHVLVFRGMLNGIRKRALADASAATQSRAAG